MSSSFTAKLKTRGKTLPQLREQWQGAFAQAVQANADDYTRTVQGYMPVRTGLMSSTTRAYPQSALLYEIRTEATYARYINDGTRRMAARRFIEQATADVAPRARARIKEALTVSE